MRILYVTTIGSTIDFFMSLIKEMIDDNTVIDIATNESEKPVSRFFKDLGCKVFSIDTSRSPLTTGNIRAIKQIRQLAKNYDLVHCHTPIAAACTRIACKGLRKSGLKVIYTAHGFHFYKGAPLKNWLIFYPVERICSHWTDVLITINKEDYDLAKRKMKAKRVEYVPGVGIDLKRFSRDIISDEEKSELRKSLGIDESTKVFLSVGELSPRKNHEVALAALSKWAGSGYKYFIVGMGDLQTYLSDKIREYNLMDKVELLGYRNDVAKLCSIADLFIFPSLQEGLPVSLMEAIASKVTVICSNIRGNEELVSRENLFSAKDSNDLLSRLEAYDEGKLHDSVESNYNALKLFDLSAVNADMEEIYRGGHRNVLLLAQNQRIRNSLAIPTASFLFLSVGELNANKNHKIVLEAMAKMADKSFHYAIAGQGELRDSLREMANNLGIGDRVHLLGYCGNVNELYKAADAFILPSIREGLNVSTMEAMASGLPCIVSRIRGNTDLVDPAADNLYFDPFDAGSVAASMTAVLSSEKIDEIKKYNINKSVNYGYSEINKKMKEIYSD